MNVNQSGDKSSNLESIYSNLAQLGRTGHERLAFSKDAPTTTNRPSRLSRFIEIFYKPADKRISSIVNRTLSFFESHKEFSLQRSRALYSLHAVVYKTKNATFISQYENLITEQANIEETIIEKAKAREEKLQKEFDLKEKKLHKDFELEKDKMYKGLSHREKELGKALEINYKTKEEARLNRYNNETRELEKHIMDEYHDKKTQVDKDLQVHQKQAEETKKKLAKSVEEEENKYQQQLKQVQDRVEQIKKLENYDTRLLGSDGSIDLPWTILQQTQIPFFSAYILKNNRQEFIARNKQVEGKPREPFEIDFKGYPQKSLSFLRHFILTGSLPVSKLTSKEIIDIWKLADFLNYEILTKVILDQVALKLDKKIAKEISELPEDPSVPGLTVLKSTARKRLKAKKPLHAIQQPKQETLYIPFPDPLVNPVVGSVGRVFRAQVSFPDSYHLPSVHEKYLTLTISKI